MSERIKQQEARDVELYAGNTRIKHLQVGVDGVVWIFVVPQADGTLRVVWRDVRANNYGLLHKGPYLAVWRIDAEGAAG